jgi:hypothetical protein
MHQEEYIGHQITVDTLQRGKGWTASYQIDSGPIRGIGDRPLRSENIVRQQAISEAKRAIDQMKP